jgi:hypothetical protein
MGRNDNWRDNKKRFPFPFPAASIGGKSWETGKGELACPSRAYLRLSIIYLPNVSSGLHVCVFAIFDGIYRNCASEERPSHSVVDCSGSRMLDSQLCINLVILRDGAKGSPSLFLIKLTCFSIDYFGRAQFAPFYVFAKKLS